MMLLGQIVHSGLLIDKLRKAVSVLFRCPKIRKSKPACFTFSRSDVNGSNESSVTRCCLVLPSVAEHHCGWTDRLRFSNFLPKSQKHSRLCTICQPLGCEALFDFNIILISILACEKFLFSHDSAAKKKWRSINFRCQNYFNPYALPHKRYNMPPPRSRALRQRPPCARLSLHRKLQLKSGSRSALM